MSRRAAGLWCLAALTGAGLTGCSPASSDSAPPSGSTGTAGAGGAAAAALTVKELPKSATGFRQVGDGLLGGHPNTDARAFTNPTGAIALELDLDRESNPDAARNALGSFQSAAAAQVPSASAQAAPAIGQAAHEFVGTDSGGRSAVSLSFLEGSWVVVVTMKSAAGLVDPSLVEAVAVAQDRKLLGT